MLTTVVVRTMLNTLVEIAEDGRLAPMISRIYSLAEPMEAHRDSLARS